MFQTLFLEYDALVFLDLETTGLNPRDCKIIQFSATKIHKDGRHESYSFYVNPKEPVPREITELTGITDDFLQETGETEDALMSYLKIILKNPFREEKVLIASYNAQFDLSFLEALIERHPEYSVQLESCDFIDILTVYRDRADYPHRLGDAIAHYGINGKNSHSASDDVDATIKVAHAMEAERDNLPDYVNVFYYKAKYGVSGYVFPKVAYIAK